MKKLVYWAILLIIPLQSFKTYEVSCHKDVLKESSRVLFAQLGVREATNHNDGFMVETYLASVGLKKGNPYCAATQYYCFAEATRLLGLEPIYIPIPKTGSTQYMYNWAAENGKRIKNNPQPNDLVIWRLGNTNSGHVGRITAVGKAGWVQTIEGNTNASQNGNQREGGGVYEKRRCLNHFLGRMLVRGLIHFNTKG